MTTNYDEKGKVFTDVVAKEVMPARIQTSSNLIEGEVHVRSDCRLKDELNCDEPFLAVTNASVFDAHQEMLFHTRFIAIRRDQVVWVTTVKDIQEAEVDHVG